MDIEEIKTLTDLMVANNLSEIVIRDGDKRILLRRGAREAVVTTIPAAMAAPLAPPPPPVPAAAAPAVAAPRKDDADLAKITSPMVGTFYASADPNSPPFVQVGSVVNPDTVVCIIEAMKVFNEIKAEVSGTIEAILVQNGEAVEFGQPLMAVRKA